MQHQSEPLSWRIGLLYKLRLGVKVAVLVLSTACLVAELASYCAGTVVAIILLYIGSH